MGSILFKNAMIVTFNQKKDFYSKGCVLVVDDRIMGIGNDLSGICPEPDVVIDLKNHLLMPGFVNTHSHLQQYFRGLYELIGDFYNVNLPLEGYRRDEDMEYLGLASAAEFLSGGCTTSLVIYTFPGGFAKACEKAGNRAYLASDIEEVDLQQLKNGKYVYLPEKGEAAFDRAKRLYEDWNGKCHGRISVLMCPKATDLVLPETYKKIKKWAAEHGLKLTTHLAQSTREYSHVKKTYGVSPVEHMKNLGILDDQLLAAHCLYTSPTDEKMILDSGTAIMQSTFISAPFLRWKEMGIPLGIGTDDMFHDILQMLRSTRQAQVSNAKLIPGLEQMNASDRFTSRPEPYELLEMATIGSAKAIGMGDMIGSLEIGKKADMIAFDFNNPFLTPTFDPITSLVLYGNSGNIDYVVIDGKIVKDPDGFTNFDLADALQSAQQRTAEIGERFFTDSPDQRERWLKKLTHNIL